MCLQWVLQWSSTCDGCSVGQILRPAVVVECDPQAAGVMQKSAPKVLKTSARDPFGMSYMPQWPGIDICDPHTNWILVGPLMIQRSRVCLGAGVVLTHGAAGCVRPHGAHGPSIYQAVLLGPGKATRSTHDARR